MTVSACDLQLLDFKNMDELTRTRCFADVLRRQLPPSFIVSDQEYYRKFCEYSAKVDLEVINGDKMLIYVKKIKIKKSTY